MKHMKFIPLAMLTVLMLASCQSREIKIKKLVTNHLELKTFYPQKEKPATYIIKSVTSKQEEYAIQRKRTEQKGF